MDSWKIVALVVVTSTIALLTGVLVATVWSNFNPDYVRVRIFDSQKCSDAKYALEQKGQSIIVNHSGSDILVMPPIGSPDQVTYTVRATYSDCAEIVSTDRIVERGWFIYENISDGKVHHTVRAR